jgi:hypothetical protein
VQVGHAHVYYDPSASGKGPTFFNYFVCKRDGIKKKKCGARMKVPKDAESGFHLLLLQWIGWSKGCNI